MNLKFLFLGIVIPFISAFALVTWIHPLIVKLAKQKGMVDNPDARKLQKAPVPVLGDIAVFWGVVLGVGLTSAVFDSYIFFPAFVTITVMMYLGTLDDLIGLSAWLRLIVEFCVILFLISTEHKFIDDFHGALGIHQLNEYVGIALSSFVGVGIINSINLIDGVDGLSSGFCMFVCALFGYAFMTSGYGSMTVLAWICVASLLPFFLHNVFGKTSKMFIGDSGTLMLGTLMSIFVFHILETKSMVAYNYPNMGVVAFTLSALSIPVFDTLRVMCLRMLRGGSPFHPDKSHLHHLFIEIGFSHIGTTVSVLSLNAFNVLCWFISYQLGASATVQLLVVVVIGVFNTVGFYYIVRRLNHQRMPYKILKRIAVMSHIEADSFFMSIRKFVDRH